MVSFAKPAAPRQSNGGRAAEKEGRDNTNILHKALSRAGQQASTTSTAGRHNQEAQLAERFGSESSENNEQALWHHSQQPAVQVPRHMLSSLPEMLGGPPAAHMPPSQQLSVAPFQSQEPVSAHAAYLNPYQQQKSSPQQEAAGGNFMQRNSQRLGGQGVASLLTDASTSAQQSGAGKAAGYMSALADLKPGLTVDQKQKAALQREQLKRDLELQMQAKKNAEIKRKQQLAEQEAREEAALRAYYARQDAQAAAEAGGTAPNAGTGGGVAHSVQGTSGSAVTAAAAAEERGPRAHNDGNSQARARRVGRAAVEPTQPTQPSQEEPPPPQYLGAAASAPSGSAPPITMHMAAPAQMAPLYSPYLHPLALAQQLPGFSPYAMPSIVPSLPLPESTAASSQLTGLLKELQLEQQHLATQFAAQSETMAKLQSDILSARRERDSAKQQLERVALSQHSFRYDHVFGGESGQPSAQLYSNCVAPLVDGLFKGYNATVFAYGQTGSGKTYTMGSAFTPGGSTEGVIPRAMEAIFERVSHTKDVDFTVRVGFVEIHKEEIKDLLVTEAGSHPQVSIREVAGGGVCLAGAHEREVRTKEQMVEILQQGTLLRATAATCMNKRSSRSHAIFTIILEQRKLVPPSTYQSEAAKESCGDESGDEEGDSAGEEDGLEEDIGFLCAKLHLVDLAGSERAKRTKAVGQRLQEGININKGLLALGNVINALSEGKQHVPYRDSKLTRMLQDSLGGNSRTVMIACVSPADVNMEETLNTLRYANRARNIRNKPVVNRDPVAAQIAHLRQQLAASKAENQSLKRKLGLGPENSVEGLFEGGQNFVLAAALEDMEKRNKRLDMECNRLRVEAESLKQDLTETTEKMIVAQAQRDRLAQKLEQVDPAAAQEAKASLGSLAAGACAGEGDEAVSHLHRIAELEREVKRLRQVSRVSGAFVVNSRRQSLALDAPMPCSPFAVRAPPEEGYLSDLEFNDDEFAAEEQAHRHEMTKVNAQIALLQQQLEEKEARMQVVGGHALMKQAYDKQLRELQSEVDQLSKERLKLLQCIFEAAGRACPKIQELQGLQHASEEDRLKQESKYKNRLKEMDDKLKSLRTKEKRIMELERIKGKAEETCKRLQNDIHNIKQQKVNLIKQAEKAAKEFAEFKKQRDKELLQLRKQGRANAAQLQKMEALHLKQQAVLRRKTEEAEAARKRLKEIESRRSAPVSRPNTAASDRPTTAPAAGLAATAPAVGLPATRPPQSLAVERSISVPSPPPSVDCQPNQMAPLLRDEKSRREWVERELDVCCASYDLQRVLEGEKAQRSECARKLRDVERKLAALKNPSWWPASASPGSQSEQLLLRQKQELNRQLDLHSKQIQEFQLQLMKVKQNEEEKGGGAADARRWNGLRTIVEARAMLKTVFRSASQHKAQAYEAQVQMTEAVEEVELLRLRLDIAEQEKLEAANLAAKAQAAAAAIAGGCESPARQPPAVPRDDTDALADTLIEQLHALPSNPLETIPEEGSSPCCSPQSDDELDEEEEDSSSSEEEADTWDPSLATPFHKRKKQVQAAQQAEQGRRRSCSVPTSRRSSTGAAACPEEQPVLNYINDDRAKAGEDPITKLTVPILKHYLKGKLIRGQEWRAGSKKREDLVKDFRELLGLQAVEPTSPTLLTSPRPAGWRELGAATSQAMPQDRPTPPQLCLPDAARPPSSCATPVGAQGATPEASPTQRTNELGASPRQSAGSAAQLDSLGLAHPVRLPAQDGQQPGNSPASGKSSNSPLERLRALNPFSRHARSRSELGPAPGRLASSNGSGSSAAGSLHSLPATPSNSTIGAAALLEKSAACMLRAAEMKSALHDTLLKSGRISTSTSAATSPTEPPPPAASAGSGRELDARDSSGRQAQSPSKLLGWMGLGGSGKASRDTAAAAAKGAPIDATPPGSWSIPADAPAGSGSATAEAATPLTSPRNPLGVANRQSGSGAADVVGGTSEDRENSGSSGGSLTGSRPSSSATLAGAPKGVVPRLGTAASLARAASGLERQQQQQPGGSPTKSAMSKSAPNTARVPSSPLRIWK
ncbi:hypothetical protein N2152v2_009403 [Parachlorella kessleri]